MKKFLLTTLLFSLCAFGSMAQDIEKFYFGVTGYNNSGDPVTVDMTVYNDFHFVINLPAIGNCNLSASTATVNVRMTDVEGLAIEGTHTYSNTLTTGVEGIQADLSQKLSYVYSFGGATVPVTVNGSAFSYDIEAISNNQIIARPSSSAAAKTAWSALMQSIETTSQTSGDSHFLFKKGSTFVIGNSRLTFIEDYTMFQGSTDYSTLFSTSNPAVVIEQIIPTHTNTFQLYLAEGSTLALGNSVATVKGDMNIGVEGFAVIDKYADGVFQEIQSKCESMRTKGFIHSILDLFNNFVALVDNASSLNVTAREMKDALDNNLQLGDVNEDGYVDVTDISVLEHLLLATEIPSVFNFWAADASLDGKYLEGDAEAIQQIIYDSKN